MCAILHDKYQWFAPGFRLWLTGSHCLSRFTQMETILSQRSHKNQPGPCSFCFSHLLFIVCRQRWTFTVLLGGRQHLYLLVGSLWADFKFHMNLQLHTWVGLSKSNNLCNASHTFVIQPFKTVIMWISHSFSSVLPAPMMWHNENLHFGSQQLAFWSKFSPGVLWDEFPNHYSVLCLSPTERHTEGGG